MITCQVYSAIERQPRGAVHIVDETRENHRGSLIYALCGKSWFRLDLVVLREDSKATCPVCSQEWAQMEKTEAQIDPQGITLERMLEALESFRPVLYYATEDSLDRGVYFVCKESAFNPQFLIMHPDDFESVRESVPHLRLVHLRDEPNEQAQKRIAKHFRPG